MPKKSFRLLPVLLLLSVLFLRSRSAVRPALASFFNADEQPIIAAQVHRLAGANWSEIAAELDRMKRAGFNTLIFRVFQNKGDRFHQIAGHEKGDDVTGVYFATSAAPVVADMLTTLARLCHERDIRLFAWMTTRRMDWLDKDGWLDRCWDSESDQLVNGTNFDLFNEGFIDYLLTLYRDLASQQIDGIVLQDDFVLLTREGFTVAGRRKFRERLDLEINPGTVFTKSSGKDAANNRPDLDGSLFHQWSVFKSVHLLELGEKIIDSCKKENPSLAIAINLYYDTALSRDKGLRWLGQDLDGIIASPFDKIFLMAYHRQVANELNLGVREAIEIISGITAQLSRQLGNRLVVKLQAIDWRSGEALNAEELKNTAAALVPGRANVAFAPVEYDGILYDTLSSIFAHINNEAEPVR